MQLWKYLEDKNGDCLNDLIPIQLMFITRN